MCAPAYAGKSCRGGISRRMPCKKNTQVAGTLLPQESRTFRSNQLVNEGSKQKRIERNILLENSLLIGLRIVARKYSSF
jgi:hypothetical protein